MRALVSAMCGMVAGMVAGLSLGYVHGLHSAATHGSECAPLRATTVVMHEQKKWDEMAVLEARLKAVEVRAEEDERKAALERQLAREELVKRQDEATSCSKRLASCESRREEAEKKATAKSTPEAKVPKCETPAAVSPPPEKTCEAGGTSWKRIERRPREALWKSTVGSLPYAGELTQSTEAWFFQKGSECDEIEVVVASSQAKSCLAVFDQRNPASQVFRAAGSKDKYDAWMRSKYPRKFVATNSSEQRSWLLPSGDHVMSDKFQRKEALKSTAAFAADAPGLVKKVDQVIVKRGLASSKNNAVVVMCTNVGTLDLIANFACSCRASNLGNPVLKSVLVFAANAFAAVSVERMGLAAFHDPALGDLPSNAAHGYGDGTFTRMMWLKVTAVYLVVETGRDVLFQDADVVWLRDPLVYFAENADPAVDSFWMDDGARSSRFTPVYANSGFYYLRANERVKFLTHRLLFNYDFILAVRSHQHALIAILADHMAKFGLTVQILPPPLFPQGHVFHRQKQLLADIVLTQKTPSYVFHMCWTANRHDKLKYFKNIGLWFLTSSCTHDAWLNASRQDHSTLPSANSSSKTTASPLLSLPACCSPTKPFAPLYVDEISIMS